MPTLEPGVVPLAIEPLDGVFALTPASQMPLGASSDMLNCYVKGNTLRKRPGFAPLGDQLHASERVMGIYSAFDEDDNVFLFATTQTGLKRYVAGSDTWLAYTGPALTGGSERHFSWEVSQNSVVFSQGVDQVMRVPFTGTAYATLNANCPAARFLVRFADRLYLGHTVEGGGQKPFRVRRSVGGDHTDWTGLGSGFTDLSEFPYHIRGMKKQGPYLLITSELSIWIATRTGIAAAPARFDPAVAGTGSYCPYVLHTRINDHLLMGRDHFYLFNGARVVEIGNPIRDTVFFNLEAGKIHMNFSVSRPETQEWIVFIVEPGNTTPNVAWVWNWHKNIWYKWSFTGPVCGTVHRQDVFRTWNDLVGGWDEQGWTWTSSEGTENFPLLVTGMTTGYVMQWKEDYRSDNGSPITCRWTSKDFSSSLILQQTSMKQIMLRGIGIDYEGAGTSATLNFYLSTNKGVSWNGPYPVTLNSAGGTAVMSEGITGDQVRWKFEHESATESFRILRFIPEFEIVNIPIQAAA